MTVVSGRESVRRVVLLIAYFLIIALGRIKEDGVIRRCEDGDFVSIFEVINDAAGAYKGVIPEDRYHEPYMPPKSSDGRSTRASLFGHMS